MKKSLVALAVLLASAAVSAQTLATATMKNGELRLTITDCPMVQLSKVQDRMFAYVRLQSGKILKGCWDELDGQVRVVYEDDDHRLYGYNAFTLTKFGQQVIEAGKKRQNDRKPKLGEML